MGMCNLLFHHINITNIVFFPSVTLTFERKTVVCGLFIPQKIIVGCLYAFVVSQIFLNSLKINV